MTLRKPFLTLALLLSAVLAHADHEGYMTLGPTLHLDFGKGSRELSLGLEYGYWHNRSIKEGPLEGAAPGWDLGIEFTRKDIRIYSEIQGGLIAGLSGGPYLQLTYANLRPDLGLQASLWAAYFIPGADLRARLGTDGQTLSPGVFAKYFNCVGGACEL